jgi:hypothetical protein
MEAAGTYVDEPLVSLRDDEALAEVQLMVQLMVAANETPGPLSQAEVDVLLGVALVEQRSGPQP